MAHTNYTIRFASHFKDVKAYDTSGLREEFLVQNLFEQDHINLTYTGYDRYIVGGIYPVNRQLELETIDELKAPYFLERRELGIINIGGSGSVVADGQTYALHNKEALYLAKGTKQVIFKSNAVNQPAKFYINSAPAHHVFSSKKVTLADAIVQEMGSADTCNHRKINKLLVNGVVETCQLQMGMTEFMPGSVWNTMPAHTHTRRMEVYFYFDVPEGQTVCHFMGQPQETRHIWVHNEEAVISPNWSIHAGAGTAKYTFIWGMAGENLDYSDMDIVQPIQLR